MYKMPIMFAPKHTPGQPIPAFAYPGSILSAEPAATQTVAPYTLMVMHYKCAVADPMMDEEAFAVLTVLEGDRAHIECCGRHESVVRLQHPHDHQASIRLQVSSHLWDGRYFLFIETRQTRDSSGLLEPYDNYIGVLDTETLTISRYPLEIDEESEFFGVDVDASQQHLLIVTSIDRRAWLVYAVDAARRELIEFDSFALSGYLLEQVRWGDTIETLRWYDEYDECYYDVRIDWDARKILNGRTRVPLEA